MFFCFGIEDAQKIIRDFRNIICPACGRYSFAQLIVTYTFLHIFFIPTFKWNRKYYIKTGCCGSVYECDRETAEKFEKTGEIDFSQLKRCGCGSGEKICPNCGAHLEQSYEFCPYCGTKL